METNPRGQLTLAVLVALGLLAGCTVEDRSAVRVPTDTASVPEPRMSPAPTEASPSSCRPPRLGESDMAHSEIYVTFDITSGMPSPSWRLRHTEVIELIDVLRSSDARRYLNGPRKLGDYGVHASGSKARMLERLGLPRQFWVDAGSDVGVHLAGTMTCAR